MRSKKSILIAAIVFIFIAALCLVAIAFTTSGNDQNNTINPTSYPNSSSSSSADHIITIDQDKYLGFRYALITSDDTIELRNDNNDKIIIQLDHRQWKNIQWSTDNKLVSVMGKDDANNYDIYIYDLSKQAWTKVTNFDSFTSGVESYIWKDGSNLLFIQGQDPDRWLHRFNYNSGEILKLNKVEGNIIVKSQDSKYLTVKDSNNLVIWDTEGNIITQFNDIVDGNGNKLTVNNAIFSADSDKFILQTSDNKLYKLELGSKEAIQLNLPNTVSPLCDVSEDIFLGVDYLKQSKQIGITNINIKDEALNDLGRQSIVNLQKIDLSKSKCYDSSNILLKVMETDNKYYWFRAKQAGLEEVFALRDTVEVAPASITNK